MSSTYLYERMVATRQAEIRHDMQVSRKPARAEQSPTFVENTANRFGTLLVEIGSRLQRVDQPRRATTY